MTYALALLTYPEILQTISTAAGVVGVATGLVIGVLGFRRVHGAVAEVPKAVAEQTADLKQSIKEQTNALKKP